MWALENLIDNADSIDWQDHINVKGHDSPSGYLCLVGEQIAAEDAQLVAILRKAGAVFYTSESFGVEPG